MIRTLALLAIVASASAIFGYNPPWKAGLHKKFDVVSGFNQLPQTATEAQEQGYTKVENPELSSGYSELDLYLPKSNEICEYLIGIYYDETGRVAGIRINIRKDQIQTYYDEEAQGLVSWTYNSVEHWSISMFFVSKDQQSRIDSADASKVLRADYLTVQGLNGTLDEIPVTAEKIAAHDDWEKEACVIMMGTHYYYKMTPDLTCDKPFYPWFPLTDEKTGQMIGVGCMIFAKTQCSFEAPALAAVKMIVPTAPQCMYDLVESNGVATYHFYFVDHPRTITC